MFETGQSVSLQEVLDARELRVQIQNDLLNQFSGKTLISYKCNIPGPIKTNAIIKKLFQHGLDEITTAVLTQHIEIIHQKIINSKNGIEAFMVIEHPPKQVKELMIDIEHASPIGRLYDIDVVYHKAASTYQLGQTTLSSVSRTELGYSERSCLMCEASAKACGRSRAHSVEEMQTRIAQMVREHHII